MFFHILYGVAISNLILGAYASFIILKLHPWFDPRYLIPTVGMLLNNSLTSISLALSNFLEDMVEKATVVEAVVSVGGNKWESSRPFLLRSVFFLKVWLFLLDSYGEAENIPTSPNSHNSSFPFPAR